MRTDVTSAALLLSLVLILAVAACQPAGTAPPPSGETGILTGRVTRGPMTGGPARAGTPDTAAAAGVEIRIRGRDGGAARVARTDAAGVYRLSLPPGTYEVTLGPLPGTEFTKDPAATVTIVRGRESRQDFRIDTGIR